jgi:hypothetical protein
MGASIAATIYSVGAILTQMEAISSDGLGRDTWRIILPKAKAKSFPRERGSKF